MRLSSQSRARLLGFGALPPYSSARSSAKSGSG